MDKIIVKNWDDLDRYIISGSEYRYILSWNLIDIEILKTDLESAVKILNALGCNLEYKEIEVIDTLEKWEEFQCKICKSSYFYDRVFGEFIELRADDDDNRMEEVIRNNVSIKEIEQKYNVDLQILKEGN